MRLPCIIAHAMPVDKPAGAVYNLTMKLSALGEFGLIASLAKTVGRPSPDLLAGIGDDAAVWRASPYEIATADILIENVHFTLATCSWFELGWKALAVNLSDIAAMGGTPRYALMSIGLPPDTHVAQVEQLYLGASALGDRFGTAIVGGDTVRSPQLVVVSPAVVGAATISDGVVRLLRRDRAHPGDLIGVTGTVGASAAGLEQLLRPISMPPQLAAELREVHLKPVPRVHEAQVLLAAGVEAAMDISDGLVGDLQKLCQASRLSAVIDLSKIPVAPAAWAAFPGRALDFALYGGEDYELLFTAPEAVFREAQRRLGESAGVPATEVGQIVDRPVGEVRLLDAAGRLTAPARGGYDAFHGSGD